MSTITELENQVDAAAIDATAARDRAAELERLIVAGDTSLGIADVVAEESKARYADLRAKNAALNLERARAAEREAQIKEIRSEIESTDLGDPDHFGKLLKAVEDAQLAFLEASESRAEQIRGWRKRLRDLGVGEFRRGVHEAPEFGVAPGKPIGGGRGEIFLDDRIISWPEPNQFLDELRKYPHPERRPRELNRLLALQLGEQPRPQKSSRKAGLK